MTRLNMRGLLALVLTVLTLGLGQVPASAQVIGRVPYLSSNPCKGVSLSLAFAKSTGANCLGGNKYASASNIPGWTYTGGTPAGTGSYAAKADGSLQFFPSYTNLLLQSQTFDNASWGKTNVTVSANSVEAPDGTTTADTLTAGATDSYMTQATSSLAGITRTFSIYLRTASGTVPMKIGIGASYADITVTTSWQRFTVTNADAVERVIVGGVNSFSTGEAVYAWGAQLELGSTASTYIPTTTAAVTVGTPRITDAGYWAEEARTNLLLRSQEFDNSGVWTGTRATVSTNAAVAPDGTTTADKVVSTATSGSHYVSELVTANTSTDLTFSAYFKSAERSVAVLEMGFGVSLSVDLTTGTATPSTYGSGSVTSYSATQIANGWWRVVLTGKESTGGGSKVFSAIVGMPTFVGDGTSGIYIWQADLQAGSFATSPIPTTSVAVTRAADVGYVSGLVVPSAYTLMSQGKVSAQTSGFPQMFALDSGAVTDQSLIYFNSSALYGQVNVGGVAQALLALGAASNSTTYSAAMRVAANDFAAVRTAGTVATDASGSVPTTTILRAGRGAGGSEWNGPIRRIVIYPRAFGNAELQAATIGPVSFANDNAPEDMTAALWGWVA